MKRFIPFMLVCAMLLTACGTPAAEATPDGGIPGVTAENYPRVDGSDAALGIIQLVFEEVHPSYSGGDYPMSAMGADESYRAMLAGSLDLVIAPYASAEILAESYQAGAELEFTELSAPGFYAAVRADLAQDAPARAIVQWLAGTQGAQALAGLDLPSPEPVNTPVPDGDIPGVTTENYPRIDGSTSTLGIVRIICDAAGYGYDELPTEAMKTVPSYRALIAGDLDLIIVPYASQDVLAEAEAAGVELEFTKIAAEALIFITPAENTAQNITYDQVREIYLHNGIDNWTALGGPDRRLVPICRNADSGSQSQLDNLILHGEPMAPEIEQNNVELTMEGMLFQVSAYHNGGLDHQPTQDSYALGYTLYQYLMNVDRETGIASSLKILDYNGVPATPENILDGSYGLADGYYAVTRAGLAEDDPARCIVNWLTGEDGRAALSGAGYIVPGE